jgi:hypothetical protein
VTVGSQAELLNSMQVASEHKTCVHCVGAHNGLDGDLIREKEIGSYIKRGVFVLVLK